MVNQQPAPEQAANALILLVDDNPDLLHALRDILSDQGYQVESCRDGEIAWKRLVAAAEKTEPMPDLLLLDLMMPGMDGLTLLRRIRSDGRHALLPVVVLTVQADSETRLMALQAGVNEYLSKPVQTVELLARVKTLLGWKLAERAQQQRMEHLIEAGRLLLSTRNLGDVLQRIMQIVTIETNAEGGSIWLRDADGRLECRATFGSGSKQLMGLKLDPQQGIAGWALHHRQSVLVEDAQQDERFYSKVDEEISFQTRDVMAVPLLVRGARIGVLEAVNKRQGSFSGADLAWMEVLAPLAAAAIANAKLFEALERRTVELQARNEELDAFSHTVAHDLQNALTLVIGFAETLEDDCETISTQDLRHRLRTIAQIGRRTSNITSELLLLAQLRKMEVQQHPLNMSGIVDGALERLSYIIEKHQAEIVLPEKWPIVLGYGPWIEEVWFNYISNAIKYGNQPPKVEVGATEHADNTIRLWVRDNGPGLTPEEQERLFTPFTQLDQVRAKGHGLGLSIVQRIMEKLGGEAGVDSQVGRGSTFYFTLTGADTGDRATSPEASPQENKTAK